MDIKTILPLLLGRAGNTSKADLFSAITGTGNPEDMIAKMSGNPELAGMIKIMQERNKRPSEKSEGLTVISDIASADIIGKLFKLLNAV